MSTRPIRGLAYAHGHILGLAVLALRGGRHQRAQDLVEKSFELSQDWGASSYAQPGVERRARDMRIALYQLVMDARQEQAIELAHKAAVRNARTHNRQTQALIKRASMTLARKAV